MVCWQDEFPLSEGLVYLNHAAVSPWPSRTSEAVCRFAQENMHQGARYYDQWLKMEEKLRGQLRVLINAPSTDDIALLKNTSEGLSVLAYGLTWRPGDEVIITDQEFPSNRIVWESLQVKGVTVLVAQLDTSNPEQAILDLFSKKTRVVSVSAVQYASGFTLSLKKLGLACKAQGVIFCVDAIQAIGCQPFDVQACKIDCAVADGHKWMMGPEGVALFYTCPSLRNQLQLNQYGWHMVQHAGDYEQKTWSIATDSKRFECGSPNMLGVHGLSASLSLLLELGLETVHARVQQSIQILLTSLSEKDEVCILSVTEPHRRSGIVTFSVRHQDHQQLHQQLLEHGVICAHRGGGIRFSPHFYTSEAQLEQACATVFQLSIS